MGELTEALRRGRLEEKHPGWPEATATEVPSQAEAIPRDRGQDWIARAVLVKGQELPAECYRKCALQVRPAIEQALNRALLVTSALRMEGKTTTACNLALALASMAADRRIALVDLDLHRPGVAAGLGLHPTAGVESILAGESTLDSVRMRTDYSTLDVFAVVKPVPRAHGILSERRLPGMLASLATSYDAVIVDSPPALLVPDVALIAPHVGACLAVVRSGVTCRSAFREMLDLLPRDRLIGCFLNDTRLPRHARRYRDYYGAESEAAD